MSKKAMTLALEALERVDAIERGMVTTNRHHYQAKEDTTKAITALREALAEQPAQQEPVAWKLVPTKPTEEMLKAMDECSKEGYDERLYAGHAASVYMAAVDAAPTPPAQRTWVGLTDEEVKHQWEVWRASIPRYAGFARGIEAKLRKKNNG